MKLMTLAGDRWQVDLWREVWGRELQPQAHQAGAFVNGERWPKYVCRSWLLVEASQTDCGGCRNGSQFFITTVVTSWLDGKVGLLSLRYIMLAMLTDGFQARRVRGSRRRGIIEDCQIHRGHREQFGKDPVRQSSHHRRRRCTLIGPRAAALMLGSIWGLCMDATRSPSAA